MSIFLLVLGIVLFIGLVVVHEWGHFIAARRNGVEVEEFGIFFPPTIWRKRMKSGFDFTINALPLGGFVRLKGEHDSDHGPGTLGAAPLLAKVKIMSAGVLMNLVVAFVLLTILAVIGMPKLIDDQFNVASDTEVVRQQLLIGYVEPDSPAATAGLQVRDEIVKLTVTDTELAFDGPENFAEFTEKRAGHRLRIDYKRDKKDFSTTTTLREKEEVDASKKTDNPKGYLGIGPVEYSVRRSTWSAPIVAAGLIKQFTEMTYKGIGNALADLFRGNTTEASQQVAGPVGIYVILRDGSLLGIEFVLMIVAVISLTLAIINVLPIPALDGGRLFVTLLFRALRKPLRNRTEDLIHGSGFALLMLLFVVITVVDVKRFF